MTTTAVAIRDAMITAVAAATPPTHVAHRFVPYREDKGVSFREFAEASPLASARHFAIRIVDGPDQTEGSSTIEEWNTWRFEVAMAYPKKGAPFARTNLEIEAARIADALVVYKTIGTPNSLSALTDATVSRLGESTEDLGNATVLHLTMLQVGFWRATA